MKGSEIVETIACRAGKTPEQVREELRHIMRAGLSSDDPETAKNWRRLCPAGSETTPEEFIERLADKNAAGREPEH